MLGEPSPLQREKYDLLLRANAAGAAAAVPGRPSADIAKAINEVIGAAGYAEYCRPPYMRTRGHSLGLGAVVPYDLTDESSPIVDEGMTFIIHPNQYIPETGYLMLGDTVVIGPGGRRAADPYRACGCSGRLTRERKSADADAAPGAQARDDDLGARRPAACRFRTACAVSRRRSPRPTTTPGWSTATPSSTATSPT